MNFPENTKIGALAESEVSLLFTSWSWTVGKDQIDVGYDLCIEPNVDTFLGHRFLVQVKATSVEEKGRKVIAPVDKRRLLQYMRNPHPVFIIRRSAVGTLYWLHVQNWAKDNIGRLRGNGTTRVPIPKLHRLDDKERFVDYLKVVFKPQAERPGALTNLARERSDHLSSIDHRLLVDVSVDRGTEIYRVSARGDDPVQLSASFSVINTDTNHRTLKDTMMFGIPAIVDVDSLEIAGSPLLPEIGLGRSIAGRLEIRPSNSEIATAVLSPAQRFNAFDENLSIDVTMYFGVKGAVFRSEGTDELIDLEARVELTDDQKPSGSVTLGMKGGVLGKAPIQKLPRIQEIASWAEMTLDRQQLSLTLQKGNLRIPMSRQLFDKAAIAPLLRYLSMLGVLQRVAKALNSDFVADDSLSLSQHEGSQLFLAHALLSGERRNVSIDAIDFDSYASVELDQESQLSLSTTLDLTANDKEVGSLKVGIDLRGYKLFQRSEHSWRLVRGDNAVASIYVWNDD